MRKSRAIALNRPCIGYGVGVVVGQCGYGCRSCVCLVVLWLSDGIGRGITILQWTKDKTCAICHVDVVERTAAPYFHK